MVGLFLAILVFWLSFGKDFLEKEEVFGGEYIANFTGDLKNIGTERNENWVLVEPEYDPCYVNVIDMGEEVILYVARENFQEATDSYLSYGVEEAERNISIAKIYYPDESVEWKNERIWINVMIEESMIVLQKDDHPYDDVFETIPCLDRNECYRLLREARKHYEQYRFVAVRY